MAVCVTRAQSYMCNNNKGTNRIWTSEGVALADVTNV